MKKSLKIGLIILVSIISILLVRVGLTKTGVIPNLFIEVLYNCTDCRGETFFRSGCDRTDDSRKNCCEGTYELRSRPCIDSSGKEYF